LPIKDNMNATFETIRQELKKYNAEDIEAPPKLVVAGKNVFLDVEHNRKRNSQFIIGVKEFFEPEKNLIETMLDDLEMKSGRRPLAFLYNERNAIENTIKDFEDYYSTSLGKDLFQRVGSSTGQGELQFYLIIVIMEFFYYE
jgi:predicted DNA-binding protein